MRTEGSRDWLEGNQALCVLSFDVDAESPILAQGRRYAEHAMVMTHQAFGPLVGVPCILELLKDYSLQATFFVPGLTADRYPKVVADILSQGHEVAHHSYSHHSPAGMPLGQQRADLSGSDCPGGRVGSKISASSSNWCSARATSPSSPRSRWPKGRSRTQTCPVEACVLSPPILPSTQTELRRAA